MAAAILAALAAPLAADAQSAAVRSLVGQKSVYIGQSFFLQIQVTGGTNVGVPDLSSLGDFEPRLMPLERIRDRLVPQLKGLDLEVGTNYLYRLTPQRMGTITIPPVTVEVDGRSYSTAPVRMEVVEPPPSTDFKLTLTLSKTRAYVGEPVKLTAVWYAVKPARFYSFAVPIFNSASFTIPELAGANQSYGGYGFYRGYGGGNALQRMTGREGTAVLNDIVYQTMTYELNVVPKEAGKFDFPPATVQVFGSPDPGSSGQGGQRGQVPAPGTGLSGQRGFRDQALSADAVIGSRPLSITVLPVPVDGRPANFTGIISEQLIVKTTVAPETMSVGDPVNLSVTLTGPLLMDGVNLPPLESLGDLAASFSLRPDPPKITTGTGDKTFGQTIRVKKEDTREVPALAVPYFNTRTGSYALARSAAVPISVRPTRVVTADDLEGQPGKAAGAAPAAVRTWEAGIFYNYARASDLVTPQNAGISAYLRRPVVPASLAAPLCLLAAALLIAARRRSVARRQAMAVASSSARSLGSLADRLAPRNGDSLAVDGMADAAALEILRESLGARLGLKPGRLTWVDIEPELRTRGIEESLLADLGALFGSREQDSYSGRRDAGGGAELSLRERIARAASQLAKFFP